jgi:hypothetical protein
MKNAMIPLLTVLASLALSSGCCKQSVFARAVVGHVGDDQCRKVLDSAGDPPVSIICPGEEITLCWRASGASTVDIVATDMNGTTQSSSGAASGSMYFKPKSDTSIDITPTGSTCAKTTKKVGVLNQPEVARFDARWNNGDKCDFLKYAVDPLFISSAVLATFDEALWQPMITYSPDGQSEQTVVCTTPPFLTGQHVDDLYGFKLDTPMVTTQLQGVHKADGEWRYSVTAKCPTGNADSGFVCNSAGTYPFAMTLQCK